MAERPVDTMSNLDERGSGSGDGRTPRGRDVQGGDRRQGVSGGVGVAKRVADSAGRVDVADGGKSPAPDEAEATEARPLREAIDKNATIHIRMWRVAQEFGVITKDAKMAEKAGGYDYATIDSILARARTMFDKHGVLIVPTLVEAKQDGNRTVCTFDVAFINVDCADDKLTLRVPAYANDNGDKGPPKAMTQAIKTALKAVLNLTTKEDEDENTPEHKATGDGEKVQAANERARDAVHKWATSYKSALTTARNVSELKQIKAANSAQLKDDAIPDVTFTFLEDLYRNRLVELEKIEAAQ